MEVSQSGVSFDLTSQLAALQRVVYGFVNGTSTENSSTLCTASMLSLTDSIVDIIDNRFFWLPDYVVKLNEAIEEFQAHQSVAYAYCNFDQALVSMKALFNPTSTEALGRMISRVLTSLVHDWWLNVNCILDGILAENYYEIGTCAGKIVVTVLDITIG